MSLKLNQITAVKTGKQTKLDGAIKNCHRLVQTKALFEGRIRTYIPDDDEGDKLPEESQKVQHRVKDAIEQFIPPWVELCDLTATQDAGNQKAKADIVLDDGTVLAKDVPVGTLLYLDKQVNDVETFIEHMPTPDPSESWTYDASTGWLRSGLRCAARSVKKHEVLKKAPPTDKFPEQTEVIMVDRRVGEWQQTLLSGCITEDEKAKYLINVRKLKDAIKKAREQANSIDITRVSLGKSLLDYVFGNISNSV